MGMSDDDWDGFARCVVAGLEAISEELKRARLARNGKRWCQMHLAEAGGMTCQVTDRNRCEEHYWVDA